jgi:hypothetical protein
MKCDRCTPERLCLNHQRAAELAEILRDKDHREALARGRIRYERNSKQTRGFP